MRKIIIFTLLISLLLSACGSSGTVSEESPAITAAPTSTPAAAIPSTPSPLPSPAPTPEPEKSPAAELTAELSLNTKTDREWRTLDGNYKTWCSLYKGILTVSCEEEISSLYIMWHRYPGEWTLKYNETAQKCGQNGFLHEYVELREPARELTIYVEAEEPSIAELRAFGAGEAPDDVQRWEKPCERADILYFPAHADDEVLFFGGSIVWYAAVRGLEVQVAYMTSSYVGREGNRVNELLDGLWTMGCRHYPVFNDVRDVYCRNLHEAKKTFGEDCFVRFQTEQLRRFTPLVTVTHAENGEYGHGAHILACESLKTAVIAAADAAQYPESAEKYGVWDTPKTYLHLYGEEGTQTVLDYETACACLADLTPMAVARESYTKHISQQQWDFHVYDTGEEYDSHIFGLWRSTVGEDTEKNDLMENIIG